MTQNPDAGPAPRHDDDTGDDLARRRERHQQQQEHHALETSSENLRHAAEATRLYLETHPPAGDDRSGELRVPQQVGTRADVMIEGEVVTFQASTPARPGETVEQHRARSLEQARALGRAAQPDNTPYVDEAGDDRRARARGAETRPRQY
ncbi:hypothetical protein [Barrientosiimonas humi]|uniref:hypothetical protein n=1 Tax=Barrientosiimonas humi TaxID=999931 RepID=UPI00370DA9EF